MSKYDEMSDFEIDKAVADALGFEYEEAVMFISPVDKVNGNHVETYIRKKFTSNERHWKRFSPSRSWSDAGPIIERKRITLDSDVDVWFARDDNHCYTHAKPLRAAMIVFLMIQEPK